MKKFITAVVAFALALSVVAPVAASAQSTASYTFNTNLTIGSRGADVVALQSFLEAKGLLVIPAGTSKGYFGSLTKSAVAAYQTQKGITPAAGYFGPITRAAVMADGGTVSTTPGCTAGAAYNSLTGQPCSSTPTTPGCSVGAMYNSQTGQPCTTTPGPINTGVEGSLDVRLATTPTNNANVQTSVDVPVYGVEFEARLADSVVQTLDLEVATTLSGSAENPATLINTIKVWDGSNVIATIPVNSSTFTKDSSSVYYVRLSGLNFVVPKDAKKVLTVSFSTNSIDSDRTVTIDGYGTNSVRAVSGNGVNTFYSITGASYTRTHTFKKPGTSTLTLSAATTPLRSNNSRVNATDSVIVPVLNFNVKSETGASKITNVTATTTLYSGFAIADAVFYLYDGSTLLDSRTGATSVTFNNLTINVPQDTTKTLTVKIGFPATSSSVTTPYVATTTVSSVTYEKPNGSSATLSTAVNGVGQYVYTKSVNMTLASVPTITVQNASFTGGTSTMNAVFNINVNPQGGDWIRSSASAVIGWALASAPTTILATSSAAISRVDNIADGSSVTVEYSANTNAAVSGIVAGSYVARIVSITWNAGNGAVTQTYGFEDFVTPAGATFND